VVVGIEGGGSRTPSGIGGTGMSDSITRNVPLARFVTTEKELAVNDKPQRFQIERLPTVQVRAGDYEQRLSSFI
jgi:hypothetical protein